MAENGLRFRRTIKEGDQEESLSLLTLATRRNAEYSSETFPDFLDLIYYEKQILALIVGIVWGIIPFTGIFGVMTGLVLIFGISLFHANVYLRVDMNDFSVNTLLGEGAMPAVTLFLVCWVFMYSSLHF